MATRRGPTAGPIYQSGHRLVQQSPHHVVNPSKPQPTAAEAASINASAIAAIHARMRNAEPSIAELSIPTGRQPRNGGMSTKEIIAERLRLRKVREWDKNPISLHE